MHERCICRCQSKEGAGFRTCRFRNRPDTTARRDGSSGIDFGLAGNGDFPKAKHNESQHCSSIFFRRSAMEPAPKAGHYIRAGHSKPPTSTCGNHRWHRSTCGCSTDPTHCGIGQQALSGIVGHGYSWQRRPSVSSHLWIYFGRLPYTVHVVFQSQIYTEQQSG